MTKEIVGTNSNVIAPPLGSVTVGNSISGFSLSIIFTGSNGSFDESKYGSIGYTI